MILLKKIDAYGQLFLIILSILVAIAFRDEFILYGYFTVGGWQVASCLFQFISNEKQLEVWDRTAYQWFLIISIITIPLGSPVALLLVAPIAAGWYLSISFRELRIWQHRHFIQLR